MAGACHGDPVAVPWPTGFARPGVVHRFGPLVFDAAAARAFGQVAASLRPAGRKTSARSYDAMIAAVAVANDLPLWGSELVGTIQP